MPNSELTFEKCYQLLGVSADTSWQELKHAYRRQSQKWHPDKVKYNNTDSATAKQQFMLIQEAFSILDCYYQAHESLPAIENNTNQEVDLGATSQSTSSSTWYTEPRHTQNATEPRKSKRILSSLFMFLIFGVFVYILVINADDEVISSVEALSERRTDPPLEIHTNLSPNASAKKTFTHGSTMREVTEAQGFPTEVKDNVWFYGKSHVQFKDGIVEIWHLDENHPLNIRNPYYAISNSKNVDYVLRIEKDLSKMQVRAIQGEPMQDLGDVWVYGTSKIYFKDNRVVSWINSPLNPLKVD